MRRTVLLTMICLPFAGCRKQEAPIGYTPASEFDSKRVEDPPTGGAGFDFGADAKTVRAKCSEQHGKFEQSGAVSTCVARHPEVGATLITLVEYCHTAACRIHSVVTIDKRDAESWLVPYEQLRRKLHEQFGTPEDNDSNFPADCADDFAGCVESGKASAKLRWRWGDGHAVMLAVGRTDQIPAAIIVSYSDANATTTQ
jgi:hypothetical protein